MVREPRLLSEIRRCDLCAPDLPHGPRPICVAHPEARIAIVGQAPGRRVHESGIPWDDPSGQRLREWLGVSDDTFYDPRCFALVPMGFCYPGTGSSGDLPPRPECAPTWHERVFALMPDLRLTVLLSQYAITWYLGERARPTVTETVRHWKEHRPRFLPLPHPSPRNNIWLKKNPWFARELLPYLRGRVTRILREAR